VFADRRPRRDGQFDRMAVADQGHSSVLYLDCRDLRVTLWHARGRKGFKPVGQSPEDVLPY
jgi:hypothetical protein